MSESESILALNEMLNSINLANFDAENDDNDDILIHPSAVKTIPLEYQIEDIEVKAHLEYVDKLDNSEKIYAIADGGADCCITGLNARIVHYTGRNATLIGYDPATTKSEKTPIVTADLKVMAHNGIPVILRIHETPYNHGSPITLLSEYQIREFGLIIDSVATKHKLSNDRHGTQRLVLNDYVHIPFVDRGGLMGFEILPYIEGDDEIYDIIQITDSAMWKPMRFRLEETNEELTISKIDSQSTPQPDLSHQSLSPASIQWTTLFQDNNNNNIHSNPTSNQDECLFTPNDFDSNIIDIPNVYQLISHLRVEDLSFLDNSDNITNIHANLIKAWHRVIHKDIDPKKVQPFLGYRPLEIIKKTLECTTQLARMQIKFPLQKHHKARFPWMNVYRLDEAVSVDPFFSNCKSVGKGFTGAYLFMGCTSRYFNIYGFKSHNRNFPAILKDFYRYEGAPSILRTDNGKDLTSGEVKQILREYKTKDQFSEAYNPQQNPVESGGVRWLKNAIHVLLDRTGAPEFTWFLAAEYLCGIHNILWCKYHDNTPYRIRKGVTPDISVYLMFTFWERILYLDHENSFPESKERSGYWVGVAENVGDALTFYIFDDQSRQILARSVVRPFNQNNRVKWNPDFDTTTENKSMKSSESKLNNTTPRAPPILKHYKVDNGPENFHPRKIPEYDPNILVSPLLPDDPYSGKFLLQLTNHPMPINDLILYPETVAKKSYKDIKYPKIFNPPEIIDEIEIKETVKLSDEALNDDKKPLRRSQRLKFPTEFRPSIMRKILLCNSALRGVQFIPNTYYANPIKSIKDLAEELFPSSTEFSPLNKTPKMEKLRVYHAYLDKINDELLEPSPYNDNWKVKNILNHSQRQTGMGEMEYFFKVQWENQETSQVTMDVLRLHDPWSVCCYGYKHNLLKAPGWEWAKFYLSSNDVLTDILRLNMAAKDTERTFKFGKEVPKSYKHALSIDHDGQWVESAKLELKQLFDYNTFEVLPMGIPVPKGYKRIPYHLVFDVKFDGRCKTRLVAGGHRAPPMSKEDSHSPVVGMDTVRLGFMIAALNKLLACAGDVGNAYLNARTKERVYIIAGPEFGDLEGRILLIIGALYGLQTSGAQFHEHLSAILRTLLFYPSKADPDLWMRKTADNTYEYIAKYVDDVICFAKDPLVIMKELEKHYTMKGVGKTMYNLGGDVETLSEDWNKENIYTAFSTKIYLERVLPNLAKLIGKEEIPKSKYLLIHLISLS